MYVFICAPEYDENSGGAIVLHRLCHLFNITDDVQAYIVPHKPSFSEKVKLKAIAKNIKRRLSFKKFRVNEKWNTPVWGGRRFPAESIVIYPEIVNGNPLNISNVVRWFLHQPGFHTGYVSYGKNELYVKFNSAIKDFIWEGSKLAKTELKVIYYPVDIYNTNCKKDRDIEYCYMLRKGTHKKRVHPQNAVNIDGLSHYETAAILKRARNFISYDDYTAYSIFAILCGCNSIVVPEENIDVEQWYPNESDRFGISYGFSHEQLIWAENTKHLVLEHIEKEHIKSFENVKSFVRELDELLIKKNSNCNERS